MDLQFYGANCLTITHKGTRLVIDDNLADLGSKSIHKPDDVLLFTSAHPLMVAKLIFDSPGEYETADISIIGIEARLHLDEEGKRNGTIFKIIADDLNILCTGNIYPGLNDNQLERIGAVDVLVVPVGGNGYTLDPIGAQKIIKMVEPKLIIPTHFDYPGIKYPVPQQTLENALKELGVEASQRLAKLKLKEDELPEVSQLYVLDVTV